MEEPHHANPDLEGQDLPVDELDGNGVTDPAVEKRGRFATMGESMRFLAAWRRRVSKMRRSTNRYFHNRGSLTRAKLFRNVALVGLIGVVGMVLLTAFLFAWYARSLPQPDKVVRREGFATRIKDRNGELLYEVYTDQRRTPIHLDQVPEYLKQATIAIEDKNFYQHQGFDVRGYARAVLTILTERRLVGGSTLTQQLVKNVLLTQEKTVARKVKEFILTIQIESKYSKDEILQMYLNEVPYGGTAWGVASAAQIYFDKNVSDLNLVESVILAGLPQRPSVYSPFSDYPEAYVGRSEDVLRRMREEGFIDDEQEASAAASLAEVEFASGPSGMKAPHFVLYVKKKLTDMYGEDLVERGGLQVVTTLDSKLHDAAQEIVTEEVEQVADAGIGNGAALTVDPNTGEILSMVGSKDFFAKDYDGQVNVTQSLRQPGSAIKPVTYVTAFKKGYSPATVLMDVPTDFPAGDGTAYSPQNYDGTFRGPVQLRFALGSSLNVPAVKLLALVGVEDMLTTAYNMGLTTLEPTAENMRRFGLAVTLGGGEVKLIDLVSAYGAFANGGLKIEPVSILRVEDRDGKLLYEHKHVDGKRVLQAGEAFLINHVLTDNNARLLTFGANSYLNMGNRAIAVKTGTTNDKRDNWTIGWSQNAIVGVWVGNNDNTPMKKVASGVSGASPIWRKIMLETLEDRPADAWEIPNEVEVMLVDTVSGYPEHDGFPARSEYVIRGTLPTTPDPIHTKLKLCKGQEKLASAIDIARNDYDEKEYYVFSESMVMGEYAWQDFIDKWVSQQGDPKYHPPTDYCDSVDQIEVRVDSPSDKENFEGTSLNLRVRVVSQGDIDKIEVLVDGKVKETLTSRPFESTLELGSGPKTLKVKAFAKDGKTGESGEIHVGMGGVRWDINMITPTPSPQPTVAVTAKPTPTPSILPMDEEL